MKDHDEDLIKNDEDLWAEMSGQKPEAAEEAAEEDPETPEEPEEDQDEDEGTEDQPEAIDAEALKEQNARLMQKWKSEQARAKGQQMRAERLTKEIERIKSRTDAKKEDDDFEDELSAVTDEYGDVVGPLAKGIKSLKSRLDEMSESEAARLSDAEGNLSEIQEVEFSKLTQEHPDGLDVIKNNRDVFREWIEDQPKMYRDIFAANREVFTDGVGAALLISRFKASLSAADDEPPEPTNENSKLQNRRKSQLDGARTARAGSRQAAVSEISANSDDPEALWDYWKRKEK